MNIKLGNLKGSDHMGNHGVDRKMILKWVLQEEGVKI
jgi:hypothetical protein